MHLCYIDESGTSSIPGNTSHFVLAGLAIPIWLWSDCDEALNSIKQRYFLENAEIHTARIIETPLFVNSKLTGLVQIADLCAYSLRRYLENQEMWLFNKIFKRADRKNNIVVGVRHFSSSDCGCQICITHKSSQEQ